MRFALPSVLKLSLLGVTSLFLGYAATAIAQERPAPASFDPAKMEEVRACAKAKGVDMPAPPAKGERPAPPPEGAEKPQGGPAHGKPPKLTAEQREIMDACFEASGLTPPKPPRAR